MKKRIIIKMFFWFFLCIYLLSCSPTEVWVNLSNTCFNKNNEIVFIRSQEYRSLSFVEHMDYAGPTYTYLCKIDLYGNEEILTIIPPEIQSDYIKISEGNGRICIQTHYYEVYTYVSGEFRKVLEDGHETKISFDGEKIAYTKKENDTFTLCISNINGTNVNEFGEYYMSHWHPDNNQIIYTKSYEWVLLDTTTSNTQTLPYGYKWSHDMQRIAYYDETDHLVLMNADETGEVVTNWEDWKHRIEWSYDGEYLLSGMDLLDKNGNLIRTLREKE